MPLAPQGPDYRLTVEIRSRDGGPLVATEAVTEADLRVPTSELWWRERLRRGRADVALDDLRPVLRPIYRTQRGPLCRGFVLTVPRGADGPAGAMAFGRECLEAVAQRIVTRLWAQGDLVQGDAPVYDVRAETDVDAAGAGAKATADNGAVADGITLLDEPAEGPEHVVRPLAPLLARAAEVDPVEGADDPVVLVTESAWADAERASRRGAAHEPPVESGAVLVGTLCQCPETGELYSLVTAALEAEATEASTYSLNFSGRTWQTIDAALAARRARLGASPERLLGSAHGHNFLPSGGKPPCEECATTAVCTRTSAVLSPDDELWTAAVFPDQPWQLALVFGLSARGDEVAALYGLHAGRLRRRGLHVLPDAALDADADGSAGPAPDDQPSTPTPSP